MTTEDQFKLRKNLGQIGHLVTVCPNCGVNNLWTRRREINGDTYYWQSCSSCGYVEA